MTRINRMARVYNHMVRANSIRIVCFLTYGPNSVEYKNAKQREQRWSKVFFGRVGKSRDTEAPVGQSTEKQRDSQSFEVAELPGH